MRTGVLRFHELIVGVFKQDSTNISQKGPKEKKETKRNEHTWTSGTVGTLARNLCIDNSFKAAP